MMLYLKFIFSHVIFENYNEFLSKSINLCNIKCNIKKSYICFIIFLFHIKLLSNNLINKKI